MAKDERSLEEDHELTYQIWQVINAVKIVRMEPVEKWKSNRQTGKDGDECLNKLNTAVHKCTTIKSLKMSKNFKPCAPLYKPLCSQPRRSCNSSQRHLINARFCSNTEHNQLINVQTVESSTIGEKKEEISGRMHCSME